MKPLRRAWPLVLTLVAASTGHAETLTFDQALEQALAGNPGLEARRLMSEATRRRVGPAGAWMPPMLGLGVVNVPTNGRFDMDPMTMKEIEITQRVPVFGASGLSRGAARAAFAADTEAVRLTAFELQGLVLEAYTDAYYAAVLERHARDHQGDMDRLVTTARTRYESGSGRLEDILWAEAERARMRVTVVDAGAAHEAARTRLAVTLGRAPHAAPDSLAPPPTHRGVPAREVWLDAIRADHPRLRELDRRAERYRLAARGARRTLWPDLEVRGAYGFREKLAEPPLHGSQVQDNMWSAMVGFALPLFAGSGALAQAGEMDAMARATLAERRAAELDLRQRAIAAIAEAEAAERTMALLADTVVATRRRVVQAAWASYTAGAADLAKVIQAMHADYEEVVALIRTRQTLALAEARLVALTGRADLLGVRVPAQSPTREEP